VSGSELMTTASAIFSHISNPSSEDDMNNQVNFLYDYYGMTEETRQDPPSPGHSPVTGSLFIHYLQNVYVCSFNT